ncbi:MAG: DUF1343 domain-containing protein [Muribaculaceae bacterium]|nr:DUF1343 domain-containing protein [Muribaculaceae bacterium]
MKIVRNIATLVALTVGILSGCAQGNSKTCCTQSAKVCCDTPNACVNDTCVPVAECPDACKCTNIKVGASRFDAYVPALKGKRVALMSNHTGIVDGRHTVDHLLEQGVNVTTLFSPEHGFRGAADAGEHVSSGVDGPTGLPIASLYDGTGKRMPSKEVMDNIDVIVVDIQDVGLRYYTYYCTMVDLMNAAAKYGKEFVVLDRPNPNGMYVDGPILDMKYESGVGRLPIPIVHGMTLGELAQMANGEGWLAEGAKIPLTVVPCEGYTHQSRYELPIAPSPNLRTMRAIYLYPSTCYFEATPVSLGRGTDFPFEAYGHPDMKGRDFTFTPRSVPGAKNPPQLDKLCYGVDLRGVDPDAAIAAGINLEYLIDAYRDLGMGDSFFRSFFEKLIGRGDIRGMIEKGMSADEIKATWADDVVAFRRQRAPYLLYAE